jgi:predicted secreted protein
MLDVVSAIGTILSGIFAIFASQAAKRSADSAHSALQQVDRAERRALVRDVLNTKHAIFADVHTGLVALATLRIAYQTGAALRHAANGSSYEQIIEIVDGMRGTLQTLKAKAAEVNADHSALLKASNDDLSQRLVDLMETRGNVDMVRQMTNDRLEDARREIDRAFEDRRTQQTNAAGSAVPPAQS